jgi:hypothetical protein
MATKDKTLRQTGEDTRRAEMLQSAEAAAPSASMVIVHRIGIPLEPVAEKKPCQSPPRRYARATAAKKAPRMPTANHDHHRFGG